MSLREKLCDLLGSEVLESPERVDDYAIDGQVPEAVASPPTVEDVSRAIGLAAGESSAITPWGGGTQMALGNAPARVGIVLSTSRLNDVTEYSASDFTIGVQAGATLASIQEYLAKEGQWMPLDVPLPDKATIGGVLAANTTGPRRLSYNLPRDWLLGIKVAQADGSVAKAGGRVVKNATGFDLNKLFVGSLGTLGVIVEATFRVLPIPKAEESLVASFDDVDDALSAARQAVSQSYTPQSVELLVGEVCGALPTSLCEDGAKAVLVVSLAGWSGAVARMVDELSKLLSGARKMERMASQESVALSQTISDLGWDAANESYVSMRASLPPSRLEEALSAAKSLPNDGFRPGITVGPGYGGMRLLLFGGEDLPDRVEKARGHIIAARLEVTRLGGHLVVDSCPAEVKDGLDVWGGVPGGAEVMKRIKSELDPKGIFNPGRFVEGI